jgi:hypothetical protein
MPIFGITASSNMSTKLTDFYQIATNTLGSAQSSITFSSIPQDYTHLQIRFSCQSSDTAASGFGNNRLNGYFNADETATNYNSHALVGNGAIGVTTSEYENNAKWAGNATRNSSAGWGTNIIDILDYTNTNKFKTTRCLTGFSNNDAVDGLGSARLVSGLWRNTAAITSIKIIPETAVNFKQYSRFDLYGIKG